MNFNIRQKKAIEAKDKKILCIAAGGSGKTRVLTARVQRILNEGVKPEKIACITFTQMAAEEMRQRLGDKATGAFIGTIHGYANSICVMNGIDNTDAILAQEFDKILERALTIPIKNYPKIKHLLIDEFQDTAPLEYQFIERIQTENFFVVGDSRQMIYTFKGTTDKYFKNLYKDEEVAKYYLTQNYRCAPNIQKFADSLISSKEFVGPNCVPVKTFNGILEKCSFAEAVEELEWSRDWGSWAVICRTNSEVLTAQEILNDKEIPNITFKKGDLTSEELSLYMKENTVKVLTIHTMKGLEAPYVIAVGARLYNEEERKIAYVAATRAEQALYWCPSICTRRIKNSNNYDKQMGVKSQPHNEMIIF